MQLKDHKEVITMIQLVIRKVSSGSGGSGDGSSDGNVMMMFIIALASSFCRCSVFN